MKKVLILLWVFLASFSLFAQEAIIPQTLSGIDLTIGFSPAGTFSPSLAWSMTHGLGEKNKVRIGYGARFHALTGSDLTYTSAPPRLINNDMVDTLTLGSAATFGLSLTLQASYFFSEKLAFDFNIDLVGLGFGPSQNVPIDQGADFPESVSASPTRLNALLVGPNDIGQIKANFALSYLVSDKIRLRIGADSHISEYTTEVELRNENDRFRASLPGFFIGGTYYLDHE